MEQEKKIYLNNTSLEDLESIKKDIQNLNEFYSKTFTKPKNDNQPNSNKEKNENISKKKIIQKIIFLLKKKIQLK